MSDARAEATRILSEAIDRANAVLNSAEPGYTDVVTSWLVVVGCHRLDGRPELVSLRPGMSDDDDEDVKGQPNWVSRGLAEFAADNYRHS